MRFLLLLCFLIGLSPLRAQQADSIQFSLLTCAPGQEIYELFGHTAIRYQNFTRNEDYVLIMVCSVSGHLILYIVL